MKFVRININGTMDECNDDALSLKNIRKVCEINSNTKGKKRILHLYTWVNDNSEFMCYGWKEGKAGKENTHDLPPVGVKQIETLDNSDTQLLYGDMFIFRKDKKLADLDIENYGNFYSECFGGFDDCNSEDETDDDEVSSLDDFIVDDDESYDEPYIDIDEDTDLDEDTELDEETELDEDTNEY